MAELKLNIGAGQTYIPGSATSTSMPKPRSDSISARIPSLSRMTASLGVLAHHTLKHVPDYVFALGEIYRVLKHDGTLLLGLPYVTLTEYNLVNPYHLHDFNEHSFDFFDDAKLKGSAEEQNPR